MGGLLRYQLFLGIGVLVLSIWYTVLSNQSDPNATPSIKYAPLLGLVLLGIYAFVSIAYGVVICKDFPEAAREIEEQVKEAKSEMARRGIIMEQ